jgi:hypothetical protein
LGLAQVGLVAVVPFARQPQPLLALVPAFALLAQAYLVPQPSRPQVGHLPFVVQLVLALPFLLLESYILQMYKKINSPYLLLLSVD